MQDPSTQDFSDIDDLRVGRFWNVLHRYWTTACGACAVKSHCTPAKERHLSRWEREDILERVQRRLEDNPTKMSMRRETVEHPFGTIKGVVTLSLFDWNLPTAADFIWWDFRDLSCRSIVHIGPISLNVTMPSNMRVHRLTTTPSFCRVMLTAPTWRRIASIWCICGLLPVRPAMLNGCPVIIREIFLGES